MLNLVQNRSAGGENGIPFYFTFTMAELKEFTTVGKSVSGQAADLTVPTVSRSGFQKVKSFKAKNKSVRASAHDALYDDITDTIRKHCNLPPALTRRAIRMRAAKRKLADDLQKLPGPPTYSNRFEPLENFDAPLSAPTESARHSKLRAESRDVLVKLESRADKRLPKPQRKKLQRLTKHNDSSSHALREAAEVIRSTERKTAAIAKQNASRTRVSRFKPALVTVSENSPIEIVASYYVPDAPPPAKRFVRNRTRRLSTVNYDLDSFPGETLHNYLLRAGLGNASSLDDDQQLFGWEFSLVINGRLRTCSWKRYYQALQARNYNYCDYYLSAMHKFFKHYPCSSLNFLEPDYAAEREYQLARADILKHIDSYFHDSSLIDDSFHCPPFLLKAATTQAGFFENLFPSVATAAQDFSETCRTSTSALNTLQSAIDSFKSSVTNPSTFESASSVATQLLVLTISGCLCCAQTKSWAPILQTILSCLTVVGPSPQTCFSFISYIRKIFNPFDEAHRPTVIRTQAPLRLNDESSLLDIIPEIVTFFSSLNNGFDDTLLEPLIKVFAGVIAFAIASFLHVSSSKTGTLMSFIEVAIGEKIEYIKSLFSAKNFFKAVPLVYDIIDDAFCRLFYGRSRQDLNFRKRYGDIMKVIAIYEHFITSNQPAAELSTNRASALTFIDLTRCLRAAKSKAQTSKNPALAHLIESHLRDGKDLLAKARVCVSQSNSTRPTPTVVSLYGPCNTGKTTLADYMARRLVNLWAASPECREVEARNCCCDGANWNPSCSVPHQRPVDANTPLPEFMFFYSDDDDYWSGYANQICLVMDEIFAGRDSESRPDQFYRDFVKIVNTCPMPLNMAECNDKGNFYMASQFVFTTSNAKEGFVEPNSINVNHIPAIRRRMHHMIQVTVKPFIYLPNITRAQALQSGGRYNVGQIGPDGENLQVNHAELDRYMEDAGLDPNCMVPEIFKFKITMVDASAEGGYTEVELEGREGVEFIISAAFQRTLKSIRRFKPAKVNNSSSLRTPEVDEAIDSVLRNGSSEPLKTQAPPLSSLPEEIPDRPSPAPQTPNGFNAFVHVGTPPNSSGQQTWTAYEIPFEFKDRFEELIAHLPPCAMETTEASFTKKLLGAWFTEKASAFWKSIDFDAVFMFLGFALYLFTVGFVSFKLTSALLPNPPIGQCAIAESMKSGSVVDTFAARYCAHNCAFCSFVQVNTPLYKIDVDQKSHLHHCNLKSARAWLTALTRARYQFGIPVGERWMTESINIDQTTLEMECFFNCKQHDFHKPCSHIGTTLSTQSINYPSQGIPSRKTAVYTHIRKRLQHQQEKASEPSDILVKMLNILSTNKIPHTNTSRISVQSWTDLGKAHLLPEMIYRAVMSDLGRWMALDPSTNSLTAKLEVDAAFDHSPETATIAAESFESYTLADHSNVLSDDSQAARIRMEAALNLRKLIKTNPHTELIKQCSAGEGDFEIPFDGRLVRNVVQLIDPRVNGAYVKAMFVKGRILMMNLHTYEAAYENQSTISFLEAYTNMSHVKTVSIVNVHHTPPGVDAVFLELGKEVGGLYADLVKRFPKESELGTLSAELRSSHLHYATMAERITRDGPGFPLTTYVPTAVREFFRMPLREVLVENSQRSRNGQITGPEVMDRMTNILSLVGHNEDGLCGSPLLSTRFNEKSTQLPRIIGIHTAGGNGQAYATLITQEIIAQAIATALPCNTTTNVPLNTGTPLQHGTTPGIRSLATARKPGFMSNDLVPTYCGPDENGEGAIFPVNHLPSVHPVKGEVDDVTPKALAKIAKRTTHIPLHLLNMAVDDVSKVFSMPSGYKDDRSTRRVYSAEEAIAGTEDFGPIDRSTSAGIPHNRSARAWTSIYGSQKKTWLGDEEYIFDSEIMANCRHIIDLAKQNIRDENLCQYSGTLKAEMRPLSKVLNRKTRMFAAGNMEATIIGRQYAMDFLQHFKRGRPFNECAVGINVYSREWDELFGWMNSHGSDNFIEGDFENYDGSTNAAILSAVSDIIASWYPEDAEFEQVLSIVFSYITTAVWEVDGQKMIMDHGQPSGNPFTTMINCIHNMILFRIAYLMLQEENGLVPNCSTYSQHVHLSNFGDDCCGSVSNDVPWFNMISLSNTLKKIGYVFTDANKQTPTVPYVSGSEASYLKRTFRPCGSTYYAPLDRATIERMCMWTHMKIDDEEMMDIVHKTIICACIEAYAHGRPFFDHIRNSVDKRTDELKLPRVTICWSAAKAFWDSQKNSVNVSSEGPPVKVMDILFKNVQKPVTGTDEEDCQFFDCMSSL